MQDARDNLTPKQVSVLTALLAGHSIERAAADAKVNPATVHRWLVDPSFKAAHQDGRRALAEQGAALLETLMRSAVGVVAEILTNKTAPATIRLRAAQLVIENNLKWLEHQDLRNELEQLQALVRDRIGDESSDL